MNNGCRCQKIVHIVCGMSAGLDQSHLPAQVKIVSNSVRANRLVKGLCKFAGWSVFHCMVGFFHNVGLYGYSFIQFRGCQQFIEFHFIEVICPSCLKTRQTMDGKHFYKEHRINLNVT